MFHHIPYKSKEKKRDPDKRRVQLLPKEITVVCYTPHVFSIVPQIFFSYHTVVPFPQSFHLR